MFENPQAVLTALRNRFHAARILVIGDVMLDRYIWGKVSRISPEAPVPVVLRQKMTTTLGGAANVAANLVGLGLQVHLLSVVGNDDGATEMRQILTQHGIGNEFISVESRTTTIKTRILGGYQQILRIDDEMTEDISVDVRSKLINHCDTLIDTFDAVIISDYAKGVIDSTLSQSIISTAKKRNIPVLVDPKKSDWSGYSGATTVTPNSSELAMITGQQFDRDDVHALVTNARSLQFQYRMNFLTCTRGEHGIVMVNGDQVEIIPAMAREVFDVSGAGDTVIATLAAGLTANLSYGDAVRLANVAAGIVVGKHGTAAIQYGELHHAVLEICGGDTENKIPTLERALLQITAWKAAGSRIVFTNGCFDILHAGHVQMLEMARQTGDKLIVGLNDDDSVRRLKGSTRPINQLTDRLTVLSALSCVDLVIPFAEDTPLRLICDVRPDILIKGADYKEDQVVGGREVKSWGGEIRLMPLLEGRSTSSIVSKNL